MLDRREEFLELHHIEHRLRDRVLSPRLHLPLEAFELLRRINRGRIHADTNRELRRLANRVAARIQSPIQVAHEVGEPDRINVEHGGRVRIRPHLWRIAGDEKHVAKTDRCRTQKIAQHSEKISVSAAVVDHSLDSDLLFDQHAGDA